MKDVAGLVVAVIIGVTLKNFGNALVGMTLTLGIAIYVKLFLLGRDFKRAAEDQRELVNRVTANSVPVDE